MELKYRLLEHPFYMAWREGSITLPELSAYAKSYKGFIKKMPEFWSKISSAFSADLSRIIDDETSHIALWEKWSCLLPEISIYPDLSALINRFEDMTPSELLGAVHAFELQQPKIAITKKDCLKLHYGFSESALTYFDEHIKEQEHINAALSLAESSADKEEFMRGFDIGSELIYRSLDEYLN